MKLAALLLLGIAALIPPAVAEEQALQPAAIRFEGVSGYSDEELLRAAGLKRGQAYTSDDFNQSAQQLMATGVFQKVGYKFDGTNLVFSLSSASQLYPVQIENLPIVAGSDLDDRLRTRVELFHGKIPPDGTVFKSVRTELERMLSEEGVIATVSASSLVDDSNPRTVSAIRFAIASPPVKVGPLHFEGVSKAMLPQITESAKLATKTFRSEKTSGSLERYFESFYKDHGYAAARVHAARFGNPLSSSEAILVPFTLSVEEGRIYKLGAVKLSPDISNQFPDIDRAIAQRMQQSPNDLHLEATLASLEDRFREKGYLDCTVTARSEIDEGASTASYVLEADPGPVYHLAFIKFENTGGEIRDLLMRNWQMIPGDPFDESYVARFMFQAQKENSLLKQVLKGLKATYDVRPDPQSHEVTLVIRLEEQ